MECGPAGAEDHGWPTHSSEHPLPPPESAGSYDRGEGGRDVQRQIPTHTHRHTDPPKQGSDPLGAQYSPAGAADRGWLTRSSKPPNRQHEEVGPGEVERTVGEQKLTAPYGLPGRPPHPVLTGPWAA